MDQTAPKRGRGRPRGTGKPDGPKLRAVADLMVAESGLKWTTAIKRTIGAQNPSEIRRLQAKIKAQAATLLHEAYQRRESRTVAAQQPFDLSRVLGITPEMRTSLRRASKIAGIAVLSLNRVWLSPEVQAAMRRFEEMGRAAAAAMQRFQLDPKTRAMVEKWNGFAFDPKTKAMVESWSRMSQLGLDPKTKAAINTWMRPTDAAGYRFSPSVPAAIMPVRRKE